MENLLHSTPSHTSVPSCFVLPSRHLKPATSAAVSLPIIDLSCSHDEVSRAILDAGKDFGFFQVVNHGVSEQAMQDMKAVCKEFFQLPMAEKADMYSEDAKRANRLFSGTVFKTGNVRCWRDCLSLSCSFPVGDSAKEWPDKPHRLREVIGKFTVLTRGLGMEILRLLCEGMGLGHDYFEGDISGGNVILHVNHYPPCPDPSLTLGLHPHCDRTIITLLLPSMVPGLEVAYKGDWIKVEALPNAFVVNFGSQMEVVTNGLLKSIEHRVTTNSAAVRMTVVTFIRPTADCVVGPAENFVSEDNPPRYPTIAFREFERIYEENLKNVGKEI
ncbi:unnamed protein product [Urochloa decumbens]|uniref:Fe2OG dioxygenase domain-containing protein n=1 Tax=Urochloa decumbens TaxID=240449 RepID=A0ABC8VJG3_9POAL